jgi:electron transfer flavoprotein-quinone oxidoreductase
MLVSGDAAGFVVATGLVLEGMNYAVASGIAAANTVKWAKGQGDFSEKTLAKYEDELESSYVLPDMRNYRKAAKFMHNPRMYTSYPEFICSLGEKVLFSGNGPKKKVWRLAKDEVMGKLSIWRLIKDGISGMRSI